jgi:hypothetical protein
MRWMIPSFLGDIELRRAGEQRTELWVDGLTAQEVDVLRLLRDTYSRDRWLGLRAPWASANVWNDLGIEGDIGTGYRDPGKRHIVLDAPLHHVESALSRALKPGRSLVRAVTYRLAGKTQIAPAQLPPAPPSGKDNTVDVLSAEPLAVAPLPPPKPKIEVPARATGALATTVAAPARGCPMPAFCKADVRATRLLSAFLSTEQLGEFNATQAFHAEGRDTGHLYLLTSRHAGFRWRRRGTLYDRDEHRALCIHDWDVPAAEELLSLLIHLRLPGMERFMLGLPELGEDRVNTYHPMMKMPNPRRQ